VPEKLNKLMTNYSQTLRPTSKKINKIGMSEIRLNESEWRMR